MSKLVIDFESFYSTAEKYDLKNISIVEYVRDQRFKAFGLGIWWIDELPHPSWIPGDEIQAWANGVDWSQVDVIAHNVKFDGFILKERFGVQPRSWIDTKGMSRAVLAKTVKNHSLGTVAALYGMEPKGTMKTNGLRDLTPEQEAELAEYCLHDVRLCGLIYQKLEKEFPANQYAFLSLTVQMFVDPKLKLDVEVLKQTAASEVERRTKIFEDIGIEKAIFSSNKRFPKLLEEKGYEVPMKLSPKKKNPDGTAATIPALALGDEGFLDMLESGNEELQALAEARVAAKSNQLQTRSQKLAAIGATGLWSFDVGFSGADQTHRLSGGNGAGGNPQNLNRCQNPEEHKKGHECKGRLRRSVTVPDCFWSLVVGDFSTIELRWVAYLSKDPGLIEAIEKGIDLYCQFASAFFGREVTKKDDGDRRFGKTAILGLGYSMGGKKFRRKVRTDTGKLISLDDAQRAVHLYRTKYSGVKQYWDTLDRAITLLTREGGGKQFLDTPLKYGKEYLELPDGLRMRYPDLKLVEGEWTYKVFDKGQYVARKLYGGKLLENICQGLAGVLCKEAASAFGTRVTGLVHDEIHVLTPRSTARFTARRLERVMSTPPKWFPKIKLKAEVGYGQNWLDSK